MALLNMMLSWWTGFWSSTTTHGNCLGLCAQWYRPSIHHTAVFFVKIQVHQLPAIFFFKSNTSFSYTNKIKLRKKTIACNIMIYRNWWRLRKSHQFDNELISVFWLPLWIPPCLTNLMDLPNLCFKCYLLWQYPDLGIRDSIGTANLNGSVCL